MRAFKSDTKIEALGEAPGLFLILDNPSIEITRHEVSSNLTTPTKEKAIMPKAWWFLRFSDRQELALVRAVSFSFPAPSA
jgi:hypothetical protein